MRWCAAVRWLALFGLVWVGAVRPAAAQGAFPDPPRIVHTLEPIGGTETWFVETRLGADAPRRLFAVPHRVGGGPRPSLSPDGRRIAFAVGREHALDDLLLVDLLGGSSRTLARDALHEPPRFGPHGEALYYVRSEPLRPPPRPRLGQDLVVPQRRRELVSVSLPDPGVARVLFAQRGHRLSLIGVTRAGHVLLYREGDDGASVVTVEPATGRSRTVLALGRRRATEISVSQSDDRVLLARSPAGRAGRWEIVLLDLAGRARVLRREPRVPASLARVADTVLVADPSGSPLRSFDLRGHPRSEAQRSELGTRHRVLGATLDGRLVVMERSTPEGVGIVVLDREASFALPITQGGERVEVAGFRP